MQSRQPAGGGGGSQDQHAYDFLWILGLALGLIFVIWFAAGKQIIQFIYQLKYYEIMALQFVVDGWNAIANKWHFLPTFQINQLHRISTAIHTRKIDLSYDTLVVVLTDVGIYMRYPAVLILLGLAALTYSRNVRAKFNMSLDMKQMKDLEKGNWLQITPVANLNLAKKDISKGPWAMALTPIQFCKKHQLFKERKKEDRSLTTDINRGAAQQVFLLQLGSLWASPESLPLYAKALFGAFAASANEDRESATNLLKQINASAGQGRLNFTGAEELFVKYFNTKIVMKVLQRHAYVLTVFASMIVLARTDGVFPTSEFLWLKAVDRRLWYMLNSVGRQTAVPEIAGAFAHWLAEKSWNGPLRTPMVEEAVKALELSLTEIIYEGEEE